LGVIGKTDLFPGWRRFSALPRKNADIDAGGLADKMAFFGKQLLLPYAKNLGKKFDLFASHRTPQGFDVGKYFPRHVDVAEQMQFGDQDVLRPASLVAQPRHLPPNYICLLGHRHPGSSFVKFQVPAVNSRPAFIVAEMNLITVPANPVTLEFVDQIKIKIILEHRID
jgi:hypothetical protein